MTDSVARRVIADHFGVTQALVVDEAQLRDLGADSLDLISLTIRMEEEFEVAIADDDASECTTVRDVLDVLGLALLARDDRRLTRIAGHARGWA